MAIMPNIRISGPLAPFIDGVRSYLLAQGYTPLSSNNLLRLMSHLSRWLVHTGTRLRDITREHIEAFFCERRQAGYIHFLTPRSLSSILKYLEAEGVVSLPESAAPPPSALDELMDDYARYLVDERALQPRTVRYYRLSARTFLSEHVDSEGLDLTRINVDDVTSFILRQSRTFSKGTTKLMVCVLRSLFRFLHVRGDIEGELADGVPAVAGWRQAGLPKFISMQLLQRLLKSCDRRTHVGRRDFAVLLLLARLGLRSCEVEALELDDVHWRAGELVLRGKGNMDARLPLPADVGEAVAAYLRGGRPHSTLRSVFLTCRAPYRPLSRTSVTAIVYQAAARSGLPRIGAHRLRHTAATQMLRNGASLDDVAQVLRHKSIDTTAIYAKVDRNTLRELARPWPGGVV